MNKQIEEMAKDIVRSSGLDVYQKAEYLIGLGYTKIDYKNLDNIDLMIFGGKRFEYIPKDSVVLSMKEWECLHTDYAKALYNVRQNAVKDTTREICDEIIRKLETDWTDAIKAVKETAKSKGVEVE